MCWGKCSVKECVLKKFLKKRKIVVEGNSLYDLLARMIRQSVVEIFTAIFNMKAQFLDKQFKIQLLKLAVESFEAQMFEFLIKNGADPNVIVHDDQSNSEISLLAHFTHFACFTRPFNSLSLEQRRKDSIALTQILSLFADQGVDLTTSYILLESGQYQYSTCDTPQLLKYIVFIWQAYGREPVDMILKIMPSKGFLISISQCQSSPVKWLPLSKCLFDLSRRHSQNFNDNAKTFQGLIIDVYIPLLQCGSRLPELVSDLQYERAIDIFFRSICTDEDLNIYVWGKKSGAFELYLQSTFLSSFNFRHRYYLRHFKTQLPLSLQALCRKCILSKLVAGWKRNQNIKLLPIPDCLQEYLKFSDLFPTQTS